MPTEPSTDNLSPEEYHAVITMVGEIVATQIHRLIQRNLTTGVEAGIARFNELYPLCHLDPERIEALMRREISRHMVDLDQEAYDGWDERLFKLANEGEAK